MIPLIFMGYTNPILAYGEEAFCRACSNVGIDGLIVPDMPPDEGEALEKACRQHGLALVYLLAPTSTAERVRLVSERSQGFVYLVSVTGITGPREHLPPDLASFVHRVRQATDKPLAVGFGISTPVQAQQMATLVDGVIVGSAVVRRAGEVDGKAKVESFVHQLRQAMTSRPDK
jgi:tryptophan synthase alpha chain